VRVLDLSRVLAGPYCTAILRDLGAEVIKVEQRLAGDDARHLGPFRNGESVYFDQLNRGKQSVTLDLRSTAGLTILERLTAKVDVLVENFRPGVATRLGIDYHRAKVINPRLIYASISGFGQTGPMSARPAYDLIVQAMSGLMTVTGQPDGPPTRVGESLGDLCAGLFASWGICAALYDRERRGEGQHLDVAMFDSLLALQVTGVSQFVASGLPPRRVGNRHPISTPFDTYQARDGLVVIAVANELLFSRLAQLIGQPELLEDVRFKTDADRTVHEAELRAAIEDWTRKRTVEEVVSLALESQIPSSPIWDLSRALTSDQAKARDIVQTFEHPVAGTVSDVGQPVKFSERRPTKVGRSPNLGEHTETVLSQMLQMSHKEIEALRRMNVV
jgi:CoA:oxalate CoA-transferase